MKNPFMSMWLSAANTAAGQIQGYWMAEYQRQQKAYMREMQKAFSYPNLFFGPGMPMKSSPTRRKKRGS